MAQKILVGLAQLAMVGISGLAIAVAMVDAVFTTAGPATHPKAV